MRVVQFLSSIFNWYSFISSHRFEFTVKRVNLVFDPPLNGMGLCPPPFFITEPGWDDGLPQQRPPRDENVKIKTAALHKPRWEEYKASKRELFHVSRVVLLEETTDK